MVAYDGPEAAGAHSMVTKDVLPTVTEQQAEGHTGKSTWYVAASHIITILVGPGILVMPYIMSRLGWLAGCLSLVLFAILTRWTSGLMSDVYMVDGKRHHRYDLAVKSILGNRHAAFMAVSQNVNLVLANVGYQVAAADSMSYIVGAACATRGSARGQCWNSQPILTVIIGVMQLLLSSMRNLQATRWTSAAGAAASVVYCAVVLALAAAESTHRLGSLIGYPAPMPEKVFSAFNALGAVAFGLNAPIITFEVQHTLREPPAAAVSMKKSLSLSIGTCFALLLAGGVMGYLALGDAVGVNFLLDFKDTAPVWVMIFGSIMIMVSMISAYQVCAQANFGVVEGFVRDGLQQSELPSQHHCCKHRTSVLILLFRIFYVACTTVVAVALPFFSVILGLVGALTFYQVGVLYPILLHRRVHGSGSRLAGYLKTAIMVIMAGVIVLAVIGSVYVVVVNAANFSPLRV